MAQNTYLYDLAINLTNRMIERALDIKDLETSVNLTTATNKVRSELCEIIKDIEEAHKLPTNTTKCVLPDANLHAEYDHKQDKLVPVMQGVCDYIAIAFHENQDAEPIGFINGIMECTNRILKCFVKHEDKYVTTEVTFHNQEVCGNFVIGKFTIVLVNTPYRA